MIDNPFIPGNDGDLQKALDELPERVAKALRVWRIATLDREKEEAKLYIAAKGADKEKTATEIKAIINDSKSRYDASLAEIMAETNYQELYEILMATKLKVRLRTGI